MRGAASVPFALASRHASALRVSLPTSRIGGDAAGEPDLQLVLDRLRGAAALVLQMRVRVDQARQHVLAGRVDLRRVGSGLDRRLAPLRPIATGSSAAISDDDIVLDDDVKRALRRRAVAVDDHGVANDQSSPGGCRNTGRVLRGEGGSQREAGDGRQAERAEGWTHQTIIPSPASWRKTLSRAGIRVTPRDRRYWKVVASTEPAPPPRRDASYT